MHRSVVLLPFALFALLTACAAEPPLRDASSPPRARPAGPEVVVGFGAGTDLPGDQDLKFKRHDASGNQTCYLFTDRVHERSGDIEEAHVSFWLTEGALRDFGLTFEVLQWWMRARARSFTDRQVGDSAPPTPSFDAVGETRWGMFASLQRRVRLAGPVDEPERWAYAFGSLGAGLVHSAVEHGDSLWGPGVEAGVGVAWPVAERTRLRLEARYLIAHDVDVVGAPTDWRVDTSGTPSFPRRPHLDTRFFPVLLGIEIDL